MFLIVPCKWEDTICIGSLGLGPEAEGWGGVVPPDQQKVCISMRDFI